MKKFLAALLASMMVASVVVGCNNNQTPSEEPSSDAPSSEEPSSEEPSSEEEVSLSGELKVAALESAYGADMWQQVADAFMAIYPDVTVEVKCDPKIEDQIEPGMQAGEWPDVIHLGTGRDAQLTETIRDNQQLRDLSSMLATKIPGEDVTAGEKINKDFLGSGVQPYGDGKVYYAPMFYTVCGMFYSKGLMAENNWTVPTTWDEMWELGDKAKEKGIALFTYPTPGYLDAFIYALIASSYGLDTLENAWKYDGWDSADMKTVFETIGKLKDYLEPSTVGNANNDNFSFNQQLVIDEKAIFMPNGNWVVGEMADSTPEGFEWGCAAVPSITGSPIIPNTFFETMWSPVDAPNPEIADAFMAFCYSEEAAKIFGAAGAAQPIDGSLQYMAEESKALFDSFADSTEYAIGNFAATDASVTVNMNDSLLQNVNLVMSGEMSVEDWAADVASTAATLKENLII